MTTSEALCARVRAMCRQEAKDRGETPLVSAALEMAREYEIAVAQALRAEAAVHTLAKKLEEVEGPK